MQGPSGKLTLVDECEFALFFAASFAIAYACGQRG
jgi:hypothetical protein